MKEVSDYTGGNNNEEKTRIAIYWTLFTVGLLLTTQNPVLNVKSAKATNVH